MARLTGTFDARARISPELDLLETQEPLASLQYRCGGEVPGPLAIPELREALQAAQRTGQPVARSISAFDGESRISCWVEIVPDGKHEGHWLLGLANWQARPVPADDDSEALARRRDIERSVAELAARLDADQKVLAVNVRGHDLLQVKAAMDAGVGRPWTDFVTFEGNGFRQPLHWRLLDGSACRIAGSDRQWTASLVPICQRGEAPSGFELYLVPDRILSVSAHSEAAPPVAEPSAPPAAAQLSSADETERSIGRELAPVLRQPIARIVANAETIRSRLAGPLPDEYGGYAADIASAGQYLLSLLDDLADLEVVESDTFSTAPDEVDLVDIAQRANGILAVRAKEKSITIDAPDPSIKVPAIAEFRRVLQVLINLLGNAIRYAPEGSVIQILSGSGDGGAWISVLDQGPGLTESQQAVIFEKFERLGRSGDGGSGLGLYISRRIARAMQGELTVHSKPGEGACFTLFVPAG